MRVSLHPAFVLHRRPYRDTSLLLEVFSQEQGRVGLVARGARRPRSRWKGLLQPFVPLLVAWSGRGELGTLAVAEEAARPLPLPPARLVSGLYVNELLVRLLQRHDPHPGLFAAYGQVLEALAQASDEQGPLRVFEKRLLAELGYGLILDCESLSGRPILPEGSYRYVPERGPVAAEVDAAGVVISGRSLLALWREELDDPTVLREVKRLTRAILGVHLEGRPLRARELWHACSRQSRAEEDPSCGM